MSITSETRELAERALRFINPSKDGYNVTGEEMTALAALAEHALEADQRLEAAERLAEALEAIETDAYFVGDEEAGDHYIVSAQLICEGLEWALTAYRAAKEASGRIN